MPDPRIKPIWRARTFANPAAGANLLITPDTASTWLIRSLVFDFVTNANVGTRSVILTATSGSATWLRSSPGGTQAASLTRFYGAYAGSAGAVSQGSAIMLGLPTDGLWLPQGHSLATAVENIDAGDQISNVNAFIIEFPTGPAETLWPIPNLYAESAE